MILMVLTVSVANLAYAGTTCDPAGTTTGYLYWFSWLTLAMAEITALGIYFQYWCNVS